MDKAQEVINLKCHQSHLEVIHRYNFSFCFYGSCVEFHCFISLWFVSIKVAVLEYVVMLNIFSALDSVHHNLTHLQETDYLNQESVTCNHTKWIEWMLYPHVLWSAWHISLYPMQISVSFFTWFWSMGVSDLCDSHVPSSGHVMCLLALEFYCILILIII
jgi:hypothetical protein